MESVVKSTPPGGKESDERQPLLSDKTKAKAHAFSKATIFIYVSIIGARFAYYAILSILPLFLRNVLLYSETGSTIMYQLVDGCSSFLPFFMAIFADSILGKYKTIVYFSVIFACGTTVLAVAALPYTTIPVEKLLTVLALLMVAIGQGGLQTSQAPLGGDQFILPQQQKQLDSFFATFYFVLNVASALGKFVTPLLRKNVHCFGQDTCFPLGFAFPVLVLVLATVIFVLGRRHIRKTPVSESTISKTFQSVAYALGNRYGTKSESWLDKASEKFGYAFVNDLKGLIRLIRVFIPLTVYWALINQQGSTWTFQATGMSGYVTENFSIQPDQVQMATPVLLLIFIPTFEMVIYPCINKMGLLVRPAQRIGVGCGLLAVSFAAAGALELLLQKTYPVLPGTDQTTFNVINPLPCSVSVTLNPIFLENSHVSYTSVSSYKGVILPYQNVIFQSIPAVDYNISATLIIPCEDRNPIEFTSLEYLATPGTVHTFVINELTVNRTTTTGTIVSSVTSEDIANSNEGNAKLRIMGINIPANMTSLLVTLASSSESHAFQLSSQDPETLSTEVDPARYFMTISFQEASNKTVTQNLGMLELDQGGSYLLLLDGNKNKLPQYFLLTIAEILVSITGFQFAYSQAPQSMKALVVSLWLWQTGMGDLLIIVVVSLNVFPNQAVTFFFFTILMILGTGWFVISARNYEAQIQTQTSSPPKSSITRRRRSLHRAVPIIPRSSSLPCINGNQFYESI